MITKSKARQMVVRDIFAEAHKLTDMLCEALKHSYIEAEEYTLSPIEIVQQLSVMQDKIDESMADITALLIAKFEAQ